MKPNFISVLLIPLKNNIKGFLMAIITFFDIAFYRRFGFSPLSKFKRLSKNPLPLQPAPVCLSFNGDVQPKFMSSADTAKAKDDPDPKTYWIEGTFRASYNLTVTLFDFLVIKHNLKQLKIRERDCNLLSLNTTFLLPYFGPPLRPVQMGKHFGKLYTRCDLQGVYRFNKFIRHQQMNTWQLWGDGTLQEELRQETLMSYNIRPAAPVKKVTKALLIFRGGTYFGRGGNFSARRILNEEELLATLQEKLQSKGIQIRSVRMENIPMKEQLQLINQTHILIGMHGAGLGHTLFLPQNAALLELFPSHFAAYYLYTFYMMAAGRKLHYDRYIQLFPWRDEAGFTLKARKKKYPDNYNINKLIIPGDYSRISPQKIYKKILTLADRIEARSQFSNK